VVTTPNGTFVFVVDDSSRAIRTPIRVGRTTGPLVKVDSGLVGGESIVVEGQNRLSDGVKIQARDTSRAATAASAGTHDTAAQRSSADTNAGAPQGGGGKQ